MARLATPAWPPRLENPLAAGPGGGRHVTFTPDGKSLVIVDAGLDRLQFLDLDQLNAQLALLGLDW